jgi:hypothetical protein
MNVNTVFLHVITEYKCHNVGAYFVLYADRMPTIHTTYTKALRTLKREPKAQGIVPKADALNYIGEFI